MADKAKFSMPDGSYPMNDCAGVHSAANLAHNSKDYSFAQVKAEVMKAFKAFGCPPSVLPDDWPESKLGKQSNSARLSVAKRRELRTVSAEFRMTPTGSGEGSQFRLEGHAAVFNSPTEIRDAFGVFNEQVKPGAFTKTIAESDVRALFNHDTNFVLGRTSAGTLRLSQDSTGLAYDVDLPNTTFAHDLHESIERGDIRESSFGFEPVKDTWNDDWTSRDLNEVRLYDVSPVAFPAYPDADVSARSAGVELGFDMSAVARIAWKHKRGLEITSEDREALQAFMTAVNEISVRSEPACGECEDHSESEPTAEARHSIAAMRLRVALASLDN